MADISILLRLVNGLPRNVDLASNTLVVDSIKIGVGQTELTQTILDNLVSLQDGSDIAASLHTHDGRYYTETEMGATTGSTLVGDNNATYTNISPGSATVRSALEAIDVALGASVSGDFSDTDFSIFDDGDNTKVIAFQASAISTATTRTISMPDSDVDLADIATNAADISSNDTDIADLVTLSGVAANSAALGTFTGSTIPDSQTIKQALQALETDLELKAADADVIKKDGSVDFTADQGMGGFKLTNLADPTADQDAATKAYVDSVSSGLDPKESVRAATTANITLSGTQTIDGIALIAGDRVLVKDQTTASENGIYEVAAGAWSRAPDHNGSPSNEVSGGNFTFVEQGTTNADSGWVLQGDGNLVPGTDNQNWVQFSGAGSITAGDGLTKAGNELSVNVDNVGIEISGGDLRLKDAGVVEAKIADDAVTAAKLNADTAGLGLTQGAGGELDVNVDGTTLEIATDTVQIADAGVDENKLASSVAGDGLAGGGGSALSVNVDNTGIEISSDSLRLKDAGVTTAKLANDSVDKDKINSDVAGAGLSQAVGGELDVAYAPELRLDAEVAGEAFAANTSFAVRYAISGETAGRLYKADKDASANDLMHVVGFVQAGSSLVAGDTAELIDSGVLTLGSSDVNFNAADIGKSVYLDSAGAFTVTAPTATDEAVAIIGFVKDVDKIKIERRLPFVN